MGCKKFCRNSNTIEVPLLRSNNAWSATRLRRGRDTIWLKFDKIQGYTNSSCRRIMRVLQAGRKIDHRLRAFQLKVSFVYFLFFIFILLPWASRPPGNMKLKIRGSSEEEKIQTCTRKGRWSHESAQGKRQVHFLSNFKQLPLSKFSHALWFSSTHFTLWSFIVMLLCRCSLHIKKLFIGPINWFQLVIPAKFQFSRPGQSFCLCELLPRNNMTMKLQSVKCVEENHKAWEIFERGSCLKLKGKCTCRFLCALPWLPRAFRGHLSIFASEELPCIFSAYSPGGHQAQGSKIKIKNNK